MRQHCPCANDKTYAIAWKKIVNGSVLKMLGEKEIRNNMKILNAKICTSGQIFDGDVTVDGERIAACVKRNVPSCADGTYTDDTETNSVDGTVDNTTDSDIVIDAKGMYVIPGLLDIHFHGCAGYDACDASKEAFDKMAAYEGSQGVLEICPATMTYPEDKLSQIMDIAADYESTEGADFLGLHLEGPFINPNRVGAQNSDYVQKPDADMLLRLQERAKGRVCICDVAPETEGAIDFVEKIKDAVASVSIAHTCTDYDMAMQAFEHGANHLTHGFNAMPGIHHRKPGPLSAAADAGADVEMICDGVHIHPAVVRLAFKLFTDEHVILISDTMRACGLEDGCYDLGGQQVEVKGNLATLAADPSTIAGSVTNLMDCLRCAVKTMKIPFASAVKAATHNPARSIGMQADYGDVEAGKYANLLILDEELNIVHIIKRGKLVR